MSDRAPLHREVIELPWDGKDSHERKVSPRKGPFDKKPRDPALQEERDFMLEKKATEEAERLYELFKEHYNEHKRHEPGGSRVLDVYEAAAELWKQLRATPVTLARKAKLIAALEPLQKQFTQEGWKEKIEELRAEEGKIRRIFLRARALKAHLDLRGRIGKSQHFDPMSAFEQTETLSALKEYLAQPRTEFPSKAARLMNEEIRTLLPELQPQGEEVTTHSILFAQTSEAFAEAKRVDHALRASQGQRRPADVLQKQKMVGILRTCLQNELKSYDTPSMKAEARGMKHLSDRALTDSALYSVYKLSLEATESATPQEGLSALWNEYARLRPGDRMMVMRLLDHHRKILLPRRQMLLQQHQKYQKFKEIPPSPARDELEREIQEISLFLEKPKLLDPEAEHMNDAKASQLLKETMLLRKRWQEQAGSPATPRTTEEFQPLWEALQAQYTHVLKLLEQTGHISNDKETLRLKIKDALKDILTDIEHVEEHYTKALLSDSTNKMRHLDTQIWLFENAIESRPAVLPFSRTTSQALEELKSRLLTIESLYPSIARLEPFQKSLTKLGELFGRSYLATQVDSSEPSTTEAPSNTGPTLRPPSRIAVNETEEV